MPESGLDIFTDGSSPPPDPVIRRGIAAILTTAVLMAMTVLAIGAVAAGVIAGAVWLVTRPNETQTYRLTDPTCHLLGSLVVVEVELNEGPKFWERAHILGYTWVPDIGHEPPGEEPTVGDTLRLTAPARDVSRIEQVVLFIAAGEPAWQQTFDAHITVDGTTCSAEVG